jgi:hypothetical protein
LPESGVNISIGLVSAQRFACSDLRERAAVEIWSIGYHVQDTDVTDDTLVVTVEPNATTSSGYEIIHAPRPPQDRWTARFVLADAREVAAASPVHELVGTAVDDTVADAGLPDGFPRPEDGRSVLDGVGSTTRDASGRLTSVRYLVLVPDGTTPSDETDAYRAAIAGAGFSVSTPAMNPDGSASFSISGSPNGDSMSGTVLVQQASVPPIDGALIVSVEFAYAGKPEDVEGP